MNNKEIIKEFKKSSSMVEPMEASKRQQNIDELLNMPIVCKKKSTIISFVFEQIGFLAKYAFIWYAVWFVLFLWMVISNNSFMIDQRTFTLVSLLPPLLLMITVEQISKIYMKSMLEIEYATKYSISKAIMIRIFILGIFNMIIVTLASFIVSNRMNERLIYLLLYSLTPMMLISAILLILMEKLKGDQLKTASAVVYLLISALVEYGKLSKVSIYSSNYISIWAAVLVLSTITCIVQTARVNRLLNNYEIIP